MDYDKTQIPEAYNRGRDHGPAVLSQWMDAVEAAAEPGSVRSILDLGCGTGRFSGGLAERFNAEVIALDPSRKMLGQARLSGGHPKVSFVCGSAEALPLESNSVELVFISMVFHHFTDPALAARECNRVLRPKGRVCLRTATSDLISAYPYVPYFPTSRRLLEDRLPTLRFQQQAFENAGLSTLSTSFIVQQIADSLHTYADKLATKSDSILASLSDSDFAAGMQALRAAAAAGPDCVVTEPIDFLVFGK
jgi:ubiquinone/menaquinone biosynthesis C-methylase UbiE